MSYSDSDIAHMLLNSFSGTASVASKISKEWEPIKEGVTLQACLEDVLDTYARTISDEAGFDNERKLLALAVEVALRIQKKQVSSEASEDQA